MKARLFRLAAESAVAAVLLFALGCTQLPAGPSTTAVAPTSLRATATMHWNDYARELVTRNSSPQVARIFPYLTLAQRNAAVLARQHQVDFIAQLKADRTKLLSDYRQLSLDLKQTGRF